MPNEIAPCEHVDAVAFLERYRDATLNLESLADERERLMTVIYSLTSDPSSDGGAQGSSDKVGNGVARLVDLVGRIDDDVKRYISARDEVRSVVRAVMHYNVVFGQCLHYRYIMFDDPIVCAARMGYSTRNERRVHKAALIAAERAILGKDVRICPLNP